MKRYLLKLVAVPLLALTVTVVPPGMTRRIR